MTCCSTTSASWTICAISCPVFRPAPKVASRLVLEPTKCEDPHVERLLEAFAFFAARVHLKMDDDFPEITEGLLSVVYPSWCGPFPRCRWSSFSWIRRKGKLDQRTENRAACAAPFQTHRRRTLRVSHLL